MPKKIANFIGEWAWLSKAVLFVIFCLTTGIPQKIFNTPTDPWKDGVNGFETPKVYGVGFEERRSFENQMRSFQDSLIEEAKRIQRENGWYSPYDYFDHLDQGRCLEEELGVSGTWFTRYEELGIMMRESITNGPFDYSDIDKAKARNIERYPDMDPNRPESEIDWAPVREWCWFHYLYALPLALLWFLINLIKVSRDEDWRKGYSLAIRSPFSLALATLLYPFYFLIRIFQFFSENKERLYSEAEIRRGKKKFLTLLSDDEKALVEKLVRERSSFKKIRETISAKPGRVVYRSLFASLCGTVVVFTLSSISPKLAQAVTGDDIGVEYQIQELTDSYEVDIGFGCDHQGFCQGILPEPLFVRVNQNSHCWPLDNLFRLVEGPPDTIFHVPVFGSLFLSIEILNQKIKSHEKSIVFSNSVFLCPQCKGSAWFEFLKRFYGNRIGVRRYNWSFQFFC